MYLRDIVCGLIRWFAGNARPLPWRKTFDPYAIWVSEIMLQQTQVRTVEDFWNRWMRELPNVRSVAKANPTRIHKFWEGLGYYTRARNLQKAARIIVRDHRGKFPTRFDEVLALPGIGRYTAGAICSIAYNQPTPILDGNVIRVLTRLFGIGGDPRKGDANSRLWQLAEQLVQEAARAKAHRRACSHLNQALMELGALVCTPKQPRCDACPVARNCAALRQNRVHDFPAVQRRPATLTLNHIAVVWENRGRFLVRQRPAGIVNGHLWEFPNVELKEPLSVNRARVRARKRPPLPDPLLLRGRGDGPVANGSMVPIRVYTTDAMQKAAARAFRLKTASLTPVCAIKHSITRYRIQLNVFRAQLARPDATNLDGARWLTRAQITRLPFTAAHKKILTKLGLS